MTVEVPLQVVPVKAALTTEGANERSLPRFRLLLEQKVVELGVREAIGLIGIL